MYPLATRLRTDSAAYRSRSIGKPIDGNPEDQAGPCARDEKRATRSLVWPLRDAAKRHVRNDGKEPRSRLSCRARYERTVGPNQLIAAVTSLITAATSTLSAANACDATTWLSLATITVTSASGSKR